MKFCYNVTNVEVSWLPSQPKSKHAFFCFSLCKQTRLKNHAVLVLPFIYVIYVTQNIYRPIRTFYAQYVHDILLARRLAYADTHKERKRESGTYELHC